MLLKAINQAEDNGSVKMLNYFKGHCVFDCSFDFFVKAHFLLHTLHAEFGLNVKNKRERPTRESWLASSGSPVSFLAHSQDGHIVSLNKSNGWHCDKPASVVFRFTESARLCSFIPRSLHAAASREPQSCLPNCWTANVPLVFWLWIEKNRTHWLFCP